MRLGTYPEVSLKDARRRRDDFRKLVAAGKDPSEHRKAEKAERARARESEGRADAGLPGPSRFDTKQRKVLIHIGQAFQIATTEASFGCLGPVF